jgi:hypothetical protein
MSGVMTRYFAIRKGQTRREEEEETKATDEKIIDAE